MVTRAEKVNEASRAFGEARKALEALLASREMKFQLSIHELDDLEQALDVLEKHHKDFQSQAISMRDYRAGSASHAERAANYPTGATPNE